MAIETIKIYDQFGYEWSARVAYEKECVRAGSFSSGAEDPEEYFGIFKHELTDVLWIESDELNQDEIDYPQSEEGYLVYDSVDVPQWAWDECEEYMKELD